MNIALNISYNERLQNMIKSKTCKIAIVGLGYVGLPTAHYYSSEGFEVIGFDISKEKIESLNKGISYIDDLNDLQIQKMKKEKFIATSDKEYLKQADVILICVPTPVNEAKEPDLRFVESAGNMISENTKSGALIILESTTYPGTTEEFIVKPLKEKGYCIGENMFVAYSPERIDPGNKNYSLKNTPKVVGGFTKQCTRLACDIVGSTAYSVEDLRTAELTKVFENTFRWINIALVNELSVLCNQLNIDVWDVINAAGTKPYGFMKFEPGIGVGGHCIPVDPYYLTYIMKQQGHRTKMIEVSGEINEGMTREVYYRLLEMMDQQGKSLRNSKIVILGAAYKPNIGDLRESPVMRFVEYLQERVSFITLIEPHVALEQQMSENVTVIQNTNNHVLEDADLVIVGTPHDCFDYAHIAKCSNIIFDTKNAFASRGITEDYIVKL